MSQSICPICKSIMTYDYNDLFEHYCCDKKIDHSYKYSLYKNNSANVYHFFYGKNKQQALIWYPNKNQLYFKKNIKTLSLEVKPYFKPNFNNYKKIINQINIWLTFQ